MAAPRPLPLCSRARVHGGRADDSEKMLLFPETVIKAAVDTLKEVAIDDFKAEQARCLPPHPPALL